MPIPRKFISILAISLATILLATVTFSILITKILDLDTYKEQILLELRQALHRPVSYSSGEFSFRFGPVITFKNMEIKEPDGNATFVKLKLLECSIELIPLFQKRIILHGMTAEEPVIRLTRENNGKYNVSDLIESDGTSSSLHLHSLKIRNGVIIFDDKLSGKNGVITELHKSDFFISNLSRGEKTDYKISATFGNGTPGNFSINGKALLADKGKPLLSSSVDLKISTRQLDVEQFWPYYQQYVPFGKITGKVDTDTHFKGKLNEFNSTGKVSFTGLHFDYQPIFKTPLTPKSLQFKYSMELTPSDVLVKSLDLTIDGANVKGSCFVRDIPSKDPRITAQATSSSMDLEKFHQYIPYGIIVKDTADWIEQHIKSGIYRLEDGRLDGRASQIAHMEKGTNYNVLYIRGTVEKGMVSYGQSVPSFNSIKGILELKGKDFFLRQASGNFGKSPFTIEGRITDYPLDSPSSYPFAMTISPGVEEVAWLTGKDLGKQLIYNGNSSLQLSGNGYTSGYNLAGTWNLTPVTYSYSNKLSKNAGIPNTLSFKGSVNAKEAVVSALHYKLGAMNLSLSAKYQFATTGKLDVIVNSNPFLIEEISSMIPLLGKYQPAGRFQAALRGEGTPPISENFKWRGTLSLMNASFRPSQNMKPITAATGNIAFDHKSLESSNLTAKIGNSVISGKGSYSNQTPPSFNLKFTSPRIDLADFGFYHPVNLPHVSMVQGNIILNDNNVQIKHLSGKINNSVLSISGTVENLERPKTEIALNASLLDISDLLLLSEIQRKQHGNVSSYTLDTIKVILKADAGKFKEVPFNNLSAVLLVEGKIIYLQPVESDMFGGKLAMKGRIDSLSTPNRFQTSFKLTKCSAEQLIKTIGFEKKELTGELTLQGEITAKGNNEDELKKSLLGTLRMNARNGSMRKFSALSKILSILNVSQLFKFQIPDMVSGGMPFNDISGSFAIKDGMISTNDLFVASNAMNISLIGKHDFIHQNVDYTVGVQPLQTVDKVVSRIPIVGWILTGKEKSLITTYFEVKGNAADPHVSAMPVKYMTKGVLDIFKRVFQLPGKLITDTGEVILGN